tara:strand:- start:179 stop:793 length:615 start_codon:yes stop_codon:yes gene_type:complete
LYGEVLYKKEGLIITDIDIKIYQDLYQQNYNSLINNNSAIKDLVLINNVIKSLDKTNPNFIKKLDSEILVEFGEELFEIETVRNFFRFSKIRNEFIVGYFQNDLNFNQFVKIFNSISQLNLPISKNNCLIIDEIKNLKEDKFFLETLYNGLLSNTREFKFLENNIEYSVCIDDKSFKEIENFIVEYIKMETTDEFEFFVYEKTK